LGIPFAEPPVGPLRFKPPVAKQWSGELNAKELGSICPQPIMPMLPSFGERKMDEDCLVLDVYVPVPTPSNAAVMVWIHGGGYFVGTGTFEGLDSSPLAAIGDVIVVAIQYRLGILGFLSTGDEEVPGNMGMYDQIEALKWVQENIAAFGGDPSRVTIFGESAGGGSVSVHTLSPLSKGLYSGAIMQSGVANAPWGVNKQKNSYMKGVITTGELVGCPEQESKQLIECLLDVPTEAFVNISYQVMMPTTEDAPMILFGPVIDGVLLLEEPSKLLEKRVFNPSDIMVGFNADEGMMSLLGNPEYAEATERPKVNRTMFETLLPTLGIKQLSNPLLRAAFDLVYLDDAMFANPNVSDYIEPFSQISGDFMFACSSDAYLHSVSEADNIGQTYQYFFTHVPSVSVFNVTWTGSSHGDELMFFGAPFLPDATYTLNDKEVELTTNMIKYWTNFAKTGNPNMASKDETQNSDDEKDPEWPQFSHKDPFYRELSTTMKTGRSLKAKECALLNDFIPKLEAVIAKADLDCKTHWTEGKEAESCGAKSDP